MTTLPTRAQIDQADPLSFAPVEEAPSSAMALLHFQGVPVYLHVRSLDTILLRDIEQRITRLLEREGWSVPAAAPAAPAKTKTQITAPLSREDGTPCCPVHKTALREGRYGLYCPSKDETGKNGYCDLKFS